MGTAVRVEVGLWRRSRNGGVDEGDDGILFDPEQKLLIVADGIGDINGNGSRDLDRFQAVNDTRRNFRDSLLAIAGPESQSVVAGVEAPDNFEGKAQILHVGDAEVALVRDGSLRVLTKPHNAWNAIFDTVPDLGDLDKSDDDLAKLPLDVLREKVSLLRSMIHALYAPSKETVALWKQHLDALKQLSLPERDYLIQVAGTYRYFLSSAQDIDLGSSKIRVQDKLDKAQPMSVQPDDLFLVYTDGMNLTPEQVLLIISQHHSPIIIAKILADMSSKPDDCAVGVMSLRKTPSVQRFQEVQRHSLHHRASLPSMAHEAI